ncbi:MAG: hypothetical protein KBD19_03160 [Candidatus Moranbacteria bacterium]|nr:hypothetical protein [Candidatus Moranbacteria bacterium]
MDLLKLTSQLKPIKGQRLEQWLNRFLVTPPDQLDQWSGTFTEVITAKAVAIYRKRGIIEEHEAATARFAVLVNACYRAKVFQPAHQKGGEEKAARGETSPVQRDSSAQQQSVVAPDQDEFVEVEEEVES